MASWVAYHAVSPVRIVEHHKKVFQQVEAADSPPTHAVLQTGLNAQDVEPAAKQMRISVESCRPRSG